MDHAYMEFSERSLELEAAEAAKQKAKIKLTDDRNETAKIIHQAMIKWWQDPATGAPIERNRYELLALVVSEISECLEGERKNLMDDKLPHRRMAEVEMADAWIRLMDFAAGFGYVQLAQFDRQIPSENKGEALFNMIQGIACMSSDDAYWTPFHISIVLDCIEAYCLKYSYDLEGAINEKMAFNAVRVDHTHEARRITGGKQF